MANHITIRLYREGRAQVEHDRAAEVEAYGWHFTPGDTIGVDGIHLYEIISVNKIVDFDRVSGGAPYVRAEARRLI